MRILILTADYEPDCWSGIGVAAAVQARGLSALGVEVHVVTPARGAVPGSATGPTPVVHPLTSAAFPVDPRRFDWVHLHSLGLSELAIELRRRYRKPLTYTAHSVVDAELQPSPRARWWTSVQRRVFAVSDRIVFLSEAERSRVPAARARSVVIPNGMAPLRNRQAGRRTPQGPIVFAGRLARTKGVEILQGIISAVRQRADRSFVVAGGHGDVHGTRALEQVLARHGDVCRAAGWLSRERLDELFSTASVVLVPSIYEPFGLVALEALRAGAPVLAAAVGGLREIIRPGSGGELAASHRPDEWASRLLAIVDDVPRWRTMSLDGPRYVAAHFNPERLAARLVREVYSHRTGGRWMVA